MCLLARSFWLAVVAATIARVPLLQVLLPRLLLPRVLRLLLQAPVLPAPQLTQPQWVAIQEMSWISALNVTTAAKRSHAQHWDTLVAISPCARGLRTTVVHMEANANLLTQRPQPPQLQQQDVSRRLPQTCASQGGDMLLQKLSALLWDRLVANTRCATTLPYPTARKHVVRATQPQPKVHVRQPQRRTNASPSANPIAQTRQAVKPWDLKVVAVLLALGRTTLASLFQLPSSWCNMGLGWDRG